MVCNHKPHSHTNFFEVLGRILKELASLLATSLLVQFFLPPVCTP